MGCSGCSTIPAAGIPLLWNVEHLDGESWMRDNQRRPATVFYFHHEAAFRIGRCTRGVRRVSLPSADFCSTIPPGFAIRRPRSDCPAHRRHRPRTVRDLGRGRFDFAVARKSLGSGLSRGRGGSVFLRSVHGRIEGLRGRFRRHQSFPESSSKIKSPKSFVSPGSAVTSVKMGPWFVVFNLFSPMMGCARKRAVYLRLRVGPAEFEAALRIGRLVQQEYAIRPIGGGGLPFAGIVSRPCKMVVCAQGVPSGSRTRPTRVPAGCRVISNCWGGSPFRS